MRVDTSTVPQETLDAIKANVKLNVIGILHIILSATKLFNIAILAFYLSYVQEITDLVVSYSRNPNSAGMHDFMAQFYTTLLTISLLLSVCFFIISLLTGIFIKQRKAHLFCVIGSAIECIIFPLGTALGVYSLICLNREHSKAEFAARAKNSA